MSKETPTMPSSLRFPRTVLTLAVALFALSAAGVATVAASASPAESAQTVSTSDLAGIQLPTLDLPETPAE
ncbi:hypothetical protein [Naasia sp. SYSU D00057]|uniref:hypothetical protein n=1 Tax=Naasia sp. SYSU D00057 TaxID=2817380 RepID=UPI001B301618|nr:hypothetical protein [Naasia sp. SYSU D00057]